MPWGWIFLVLLAFVGGAIYADLFNAKSKLRAWLAQWFETFEITAVFARHEMEKPERVEIWCLIRTVRFLKNPLLTIKTIPLKKSPYLSTEVIRQERLGEITKDTELRLIVGSIMIPSPGWTPRYSVWGEQYGIEKHDPGLKVMGGKSKNFIEVALGGRKQTFYLELRDPNDSASTHVILVREGEIPL